MYGARDEPDKEGYQAIHTGGTYRLSHYRSKVGDEISRYCCIMLTCQLNQLQDTNQIVKWQDLLVHLSKRRENRAVMKK